MILLLVSILVPACLFYAVVFVNFQREVVKGRHKKFHTGKVIYFTPTDYQGSSKKFYSSKVPIWAVSDPLAGLRVIASDRDPDPDHRLPARTRSCSETSL